MAEIPLCNVPAVLKLKHVKSLCILSQLRRLSAMSCWSHTAFLKKEKTPFWLISIGSVWVSRPILLQPVWSSYRTHSKSLQNPGHPSQGTGMLFWVAEFCLPARIHCCGSETQINWWMSLLVEYQPISGYLQTLYSSGCININGLKCFLLPARTWCCSWSNTALIVMVWGLNITDLCP